MRESQTFSGASWQLALRHRPRRDGPFDFGKVERVWTVTHHNVEDLHPSVFEFDSIPSAMRFLDECGVSRTIRS